MTQLVELREGFVIILQDPKGKDVRVKPSDVVLIFFSKFICPPGANSNVIYKGAIRSFQNGLDDAAAKVGAELKIVKLTLPAGPVSPEGPGWFSIPKIEELKSLGKRGTQIEMSGQQGGIRVLEALKDVEDAIREAGGAPPE